MSPLSRENTAATIWAVLHGDVPTTRTRGPIGPVIGGLLQRDPRARLGGPQAAALLAGGESAAQQQAPPDAPTRPVLPDPPRRRWWPWAVSALLVGLLAGAGGGYALASSGAPAAVGLSYGDGGQLPEFDVSTSRPCLLVAPAAGRAIGSSSAVDCDERHEAEVFAEIPLYSSNRVIAYPGAPQLVGFGAAACRFYFDSPLIVGADQARLEAVALVPSEATFQHDSSSVPSSPSFSGRSVYCVLRAADGSQLAGTRISTPPS